MKKTAFATDSKRFPGKTKTGLAEYIVGKEGFEPSRLSARDPKSRLSANSSTSPIIRTIYLMAKLYTGEIKTSIIGYNLAINNFKFNYGLTY